MDKARVYFAAGVLLCSLCASHAAASSQDREKRQASSRRVGETCIYNTDCMNGMFCNAGICSCFSNYIQYNHYCYPRIDPGQSGCQYTEQCIAVWPDTTCESGRCRCPLATPRDVQTPDGWVCVRQDAATQPASCPLPYVSTPLSVDDTDAILLNPDGSQVQCVVGETCSVISPSDGATRQLADMYDCIPIAAAPSGSSTVAGVCCPSRALTCMLPMVTETGGGVESRWYFNSVTRSCVQFSYARPTDGRMANANNFKSRQQCESYCLNACPRGAPLYDTQQTSPANNMMLPRRLTRCTQSCSNQDYNCRSIGSESRCCLTTKALCSLPVNPGLDAVPGPMEVTTKLIPTVSRFYYDTTQRRCISFVWTQQGGNWNNFESEASCNSHCSSLLCERGAPIKDESGQNMQCSGNSQCPSSHTCSTGVCCPSKQTVCAQPQVVGTCTQPSARYWYNAATKDCQQFSFSGCQGNANNFQTMLECQNFCRGAVEAPTCPQGSAYKDGSGNFISCGIGAIGGASGCPINHECTFDGRAYACCPTKTYTCSLTLHSGVNCGPRSNRWFYDTKTQTCQSFQYEGCDGNSNNFNTKEQCEQYCGVGGCPYGGAPFRDTNNQLRICRNGGTTCPTTHECTIVTISSTSAISYCCPTKAYICSQHPLQGLQCGAQIQRWYFNTATKQCQSFNYNGCGTNGNNFATLTQCQNFCGSSACASGERALMDTLNPTRLMSCNVGAASNTCPESYRCIRDSLTGASICCGSTDMGVCQTGEKAYIDSFTQIPRTCLPSNPASCPANYLCRLATTGRSGYFCCQSSSGNVCPAGRAQQRVGTQPVICSLGSVVNSCAAGYSCAAAIQGTFQGYCCSNNVICPGGGEYYVDLSSQMPRQCIVGSSACPGGFSCSPALGIGGVSNVGYCCRGAAQGLIIPQGISLGQGGCPAGQTAWQQGGQPANCNPQIPASCPQGYTCVYSQALSRNQCCGFGQVNTPAASVSGCPPGLNPILDPVSLAPRQCQLGGTLCPDGYSCQYAAQFNRYQCCGQGPTNGGNQVTSTVVCPIPGQLPLMDGNRPRSCQLFAPNCGNSHTCQLVMNQPGGASYICCGSPGFGTTPNNNYGQASPIVGLQPGSICPSGIAYISPDGGLPLECTNNFYSCPGGYVCTYSQSSRKYFCCSSSQTSPGNVSNTMLVRQSFHDCMGNCFDETSGCSAPYSCQLVNNMFQCCRSGMVTASQAPGKPLLSQHGCPLGSSPFMYPVIQRPLICQSQYSTCPSGYRCELSALTPGQYLCCTTSGGWRNSFLSQAKRDAIAHQSNNNYLRWANQR